MFLQKYCSFRLLYLLQSLFNKDIRLENSYDLMINVSIILIIFNNIWVLKGKYFLKLILEI